LALLSDTEDRLLAMCEGDSVTIKSAQSVLGAWYERPFGEMKIIQMANRLARLGLLKWQYRRKNKRYCTKAFPRRCTDRKLLTLQTTAAGETHLAKPRSIIEHSGKLGFHQPRT
jgi:hypothetical protein